MKIFCQKLKREGNKLPRKPIAGALGDRIFAEISQEGWDLWLKQQTMLLNEYRLSSIDEETQEFLREKMEEFLFNDEQVAPKEYRPETSGKK